MSIGNDGSHGFVDREERCVGNAHINHLIGMFFDVMDDRVDFCEKFREVTNDFLRVRMGSYHYYSKQYLFIETIS